MCALSGTSDCFGGSSCGSNAMAAPNQQITLARLGIGVGSFNFGLGSLTLAGMPNRRSLAQWLVQLNVMNSSRIDVSGTHEVSLVGGRIPIVKVMPYVPPTVVCRTITVFPI